MAIWHKGRGSGGGFTAQSGKQTKFHPVVPQGTHSSKHRLLIRCSVQNLTVKKAMSGFKKNTERGLWLQVLPKAWGKPIHGRLQKEI